MPKIRSLSIFLISIVLVTIAGCTSTKKSEPNAIVPVGVKYEITNFDFDLVQKYNVPGFFNEAQTKEIMLLTIRSKLDEQGMLAKPSDNNSYPIEIKLDYKRNFVGEDTPFPADMVAPPKFYYSIYANENGQLASIYTSKEMTTTAKSIFYFGIKENQQDDLLYSITAATDIAQKIIDNTPKYDGYASSPISKEQFNIVLTAKAVEIAGQINTDTLKGYIPSEITDKYLAMINNPDFETRMEGYEEMQKQWLNQPELFDVINHKVLENYTNNLNSQQKEEIEEQILTIANAGLIEYMDTLTIVSKSANDKSLQKYANDKIELMEERFLKTYLIHQPLPKGISANWRQHQLYNMLNSEDLYLQRIAVKTIYRDFPKDDFLLDTLSEQLKESLTPGYSAVLRADYHAWICRVLGMSENPKYKNQLEYTAEYAYTRKARNFAEEFADEL